jgi:hypothetical protein
MIWLPRTYSEQRFFETNRIFFGKDAHQDIKNFLKYLESHLEDLGREYQVLDEPMYQGCCYELMNLASRFVQRGLMVIVGSSEDNMGDLQIYGTARFPSKTETIFLEFIFPDKRYYFFKPNDPYSLIADYIRIGRLRNAFERKMAFDISSRMDDDGCICFECKGRKRKKRLLRKKDVILARDVFRDDVMF